MNDSVGLSLSNTELTHQIYHLSCEIQNAQFTDRLIKNKQNKNMTPSEQLFAGFFQNEKSIVPDMDDSQLEEHISALEQIALEARARLYAAEDEKRERKSKNKKFTVSGDNETLTTNAINAISERNKKLSKREKMIENLIKSIGCSRSEAEAMIPDTDKMSLGKAIKKSEAIEKLANQLPTRNIESTVVGDMIANALKSTKSADSKPFANPFSSVSISDSVSVEINEDTKTITITETKETVNVNEPKPFVNPFS